MRKLVSLVILGFVCVSMFAVPATAQSGASPRVVATYFHRTMRCQTCLRIESLAQYAITQEKASDIESGQLAWRSVNIDDEANAGFAKQYELEGSSLVITLEDCGTVLKWVRLDGVWEIYDDVKAFDRLVLGTVDEYLAAASEIATSPN